MTSPMEELHATCRGLLGELARVDAQTVDALAASDLDAAERGFAVRGQLLNRLAEAMSALEHARGDGPPSPAEQALGRDVVRGLTDRVRAGTELATLVERVSAAAASELRAVKDRGSLLRHQSLHGPSSPGGWCDVRR